MRGGNRLTKQPCDECGAARASRHRLCSRCRGKVTCPCCRGPKPRGQHYCDPCMYALACIAGSHGHPCEADNIGREARVAELARRVAAGLPLWGEVPGA